MNDENKINNPIYKPVTYDERSKCWACEEKSTTEYKNVPYCGECFKSAKLQIIALEEQSRAIRAETMYQKAISLLFRHNFPVQRYKKECSWVCTKLMENPNIVDSTPELMTAIILTAYKIPISCQYKYIGYSIDFKLSSKKVLLEIDGDRHNKDKDQMRDECIYGHLPKDWTIVRIKADFVEDYPNKVISEIDKQIQKRMDKVQLYRGFI